MNVQGVHPVYKVVHMKPPEIPRSTAVKRTRKDLTRPRMRAMIMVVIILCCIQAREEVARSLQIKGRPRGTATARTFILDHVPRSTLYLLYGMLVAIAVLIVAMGSNSPMLGLHLPQKQNIN